jgi:hypothetical protein
MDDTTREFCNTIFIAFASASGVGVLDEATAIIAEAVDEGCVRDPDAREALRHLVAACPPDPIEQASAAAVNLTGSAGDLSAATGDDSLARVAAHIARRVSRITASSPAEEIQAVIDLVDGLEAAARRVKTEA